VAIVIDATSPSAAEAPARPYLPVLALSGVAHRYGATPTFSDFDLTLASGELCCLLGPSGCGKTTALRCIGGFERVAAGSIAIDGSVVSRAGGRHVPPERRRIGMVFQDLALFPHLTVARNVAFGIGERGKAAARVAAMLAAVGLEWAADRLPHELSGGQQQRVALARTLAPAPRLLLLDEPFSSLDAGLREVLAADVREILKSAGTTAVFVTHDQNEAFALADRIAVMHEGRIQQVDSAYNLYHRPRNRFVADFIGRGVLVEATVLASRRLGLEIAAVECDESIRLADTGALCRPGERVDVLLRHDDVVHDDTSAVKAMVRAKAFRGAEILYTLQLASGATVLSLVPSHHNHTIGEPIGIRLELDHVIAFAPQRQRQAAHATTAPR
jgi:iron(III) transport system ATP-binding protein